ncbi:MAG: phosphodiester glycosidase family protein [Bacteroidota bacterium]
MNHNTLSFRQIAIALGTTLLIAGIIVAIGVISGANSSEKKAENNKKNASPITQTAERPVKVATKRPTANLNKSAHTFDYLKKPFTAFIFDVTQQQLNFSLHNAKGANYSTLTAVTDTLEKMGNKVLFATNAGIFAPDQQPEGLFVANGEVLTELNLEKGKGNFYLQPNGVFFLTKAGKLGVLPSKTFAEQDVAVTYATQSGPLLLRNDTIHEAINQGSPNLRVRNGVGIISPTKAVFVISEIPVNFYDFTMVFKDYFGCRDALYLDGVISEIYLPELERTESKGEFAGIISVTD